MRPVSMRPRALSWIEAWRSTLVATLIFATILAAGCQRANYPKAQVTSAVGQPALCQHCLKPLDSVRREQLVVFDGVQYTVCDDDCAGALKKTLDEQKDR